MNWDAIGAVGEILGAIAVMLSLVYLATQIRVSNKSAKQSTMQSQMHEATTFLGRISSDTTTCKIWSVGLLVPDSLTPLELTQFSTLCLEMTLIYERLYYLNQSSSIESHFSHSMTQAIRRVLGSPGYKVWFEDRKGDFTIDFTNWLSVEQSTSGEYVPFSEILNKSISSYERNDDL